MTKERAGAYGFHLPDLAFTGRLGTAPPGWADWRIRITIDSDLDLAACLEEVGDDAAVIVHHPLGIALLDRGRSETELRLLEEPTPESLVHPLLASTAIIANHWMGRPSFHAGGFVYKGRAWGVLGAREDGKSSTLGWMVRSGFDVLSDDALVIAGGSALAGPRCLDLRAGAADYFGLGEALGIVGTRERWRVQLAPVEPEVPLAGWVSLKWAESPSVEPLPLARRIPRLLEARGLLASLTGDALSWLDLGTLPSIELSRPRRWSEIDASMQMLLDALSMAQ